MYTGRCNVHINIQRRTVEFTQSCIYCLARVRVLNEFVAVTKSFIVWCASSPADTTVAIYIINLLRNPCITRWRCVFYDCADGVVDDTGGLCQYVAVAGAVVVPASWRPVQRPGTGRRRRSLRRGRCSVDRRRTPVVRRPSARCRRRRHAARLLRYRRRVVRQVSALDALWISPSRVVAAGNVDECHPLGLQKISHTQCLH